MNSLQKRAEELKEEQIHLKQSINEKNTASILVGLFCTENACDNHSIDPKIEELLRRPTEDIPDASKLPELPALILPGQHNCKKLKSSESITSDQTLPNDGIDYGLLGKDRSKCTPAELDQIRRERNRMHAKRTRDRKRLFMDEMAEMCKRLEEENALLQAHLKGLDDKGTIQEPCLGPAVISPSLPATPSEHVPPIESNSVTCITSPQVASTAPEKVTVGQHGVTLDQIKTLLEAAGAFSSTSAVSTSTHDSEGDSISDHDEHAAPFKRRRLADLPGMSSSVSSSVPRSITTSAATAVGC